MHFGVATVFPEMLDTALRVGVVSRARESGLVHCNFANPRDWASDRHRTIDDRPFGGGPGMVMKAEPLASAVNSLRKLVPAAPVVCLSPQGKRFDQAMAKRWQQGGALILISGRYEGIDERLVESLVDEEVSLGDFVLSGGETAALVIIDAVSRLVPGVLGDPLSAEQDSFGEDGLLDCPHYTRPEQYEGRVVPKVLLSGDHKAIARWRRQQALIRTRDRRPDLLATAKLTAEDKKFLETMGHEQDH